MFNHKFQFKLCRGKMVDLDHDRYKQLIRGLPDDEYELIVRKKITWDTHQMRKYFHGPCLEFVMEQFKVLGHIYTKEEVKLLLKTLFGKKKSYVVTALPCSTAEYDHDFYVQFINNIDAWCIECFECGLPPAEQVE